MGEIYSSNNYGWPIFFESCWNKKAGKLMYHLQ